MIINQPGATFTYGGVEYVIGAPVIGTKESEYEGLYGTIIEIRDGDDKETENETPDLYCEFDPPVLPHEIKRLEEIFSDLYDEPKSWMTLSWIWSSWRRRWCVRWRICIVARSKRQSMS